jgi:hypothetical protein
MLADVGYEVARDVVGHAKGTKRREIVRALTELGQEVGDLHTLAEGELPPPGARGLLLVRKPFASDLKRPGHWVVLDGAGAVLDPCVDDEIRIEEFRTFALFEHGTRVRLQWIPVRPPK